VDICLIYTNYANILLKFNALDKTPFSFGFIVKLRKFYLKQGARENLFKITRKIPPRKLISLLEAYFKSKLPEKEVKFK